MRIALAQINTTVGDLEGNTALILRTAREAATRGAELAVFPELAINGYPPRDLVEKESFLDRTEQQLQRLAQETAGLGLAIICGYAGRSHSPTGKRAANCAAVIDHGDIVFRQTKMLLPTYDVFDEARYFVPGERESLFTFRGRQVALTICEDAWNDKQFWERRLYRQDPVEASCASFQEDLVLVDTEGGGLQPARDFSPADPVLAPNRDREGADEGADPDAEPAAVYEALVLGTRDYLHKCGFRQALIGLSGGIDSSLTAAIAVDAVGPDNVIGVGMPGPYSSQGSLTDACALAQNLGIRFEVANIAAVYDKYLDTLAPLFAGTAPGVAEENLQARIRGALLMALSNKYGCLVLTTGNKSELAVGYCTLYGDMCGGLAVISDVPKTLVYQLSRVANQRRPGAIPESVFEKPPSAELRPDQKDTDSLPPYEILDEVLRCYVEEYETPGQIAEKLGLALDFVKGIVNTVDRNEYKRQQAAPGLKVTTKAFGIGRRFPIAQRFSE